MKKIMTLLILVSSSCFTLATERPTKVGDIIPWELYKQCCPGPACHADKDQDQVNAEHLQSQIDFEIVKLEELKTCADLAKALK